MFSPITKALIKIFAKGFFRVNSGPLIFLCVTIGISFFFIETAGDIRLLTPDELTFYHFILVITFISSPAMTLVIFFAWLIYTLKSWQYVIGQLFIPNNQFLFYSTTSLNKSSQVRSWFCVQMMIFMPIICYWLFSLAFGIVLHQYVLPLVIVLYIILLASISAFLYMLLVNRSADGNKQTYFLQLSRKWHKPYFSLFIYHVFDNMKLTYGITKAVSLLTILGLLNSFDDANNDLRVAGLIILSVITAHSFLVYQEHRFVETQMSFSRNLPYSRVRLFINFALVSLLLIAPESIWLFTTFNPGIAIGLLLFGLSIALIFRSLLYWFGLGMFTYLRWVFGLYVLFFLVIMFRLFWLLIPLNLLVSFMVFYVNYYSRKSRE